MLSLRPHQAEVVQKINQGFEDGHRCQLLYAPTGFGKTEVAMAIMKEVSRNYKKTAMVLDRIVLVDQTSTRLARYKIDHGVMMAGHWRYRPNERIQICSAQTLEKRSHNLDIDLLIIDECHVQRASTIEMIKNKPGMKVIGLTATPFTAGLGNIYTHVVGAKSTGELIDDGWLTPLRIFIAKEIDMSGVTKVAGEWSQDQVTERGMKITGDIVAEWIKQTNRIFGKPVKTVVFSAGVDHGRDLERQFKEQGYNFAAISYKEDGEYKRETIEEFSKSDTTIHGLIATDILTRGFDVPDVMIGVSARPFSKSFSSHVQQMGRVMRPFPGKKFGVWLCLAKGSLVLTNSGLVPIDKVKFTHKIWDGTNFVTHSGAVCNGIQEVITYQGLTATTGHLVHTAKGWRTFGDCADKQIRITQTGLGGQAIRLGDDFRSASFLVGRTAAKVYSCFVRVRDLWLQKPDKSEQFANRKNERLSEMQSARRGVSDVALQQSTSHEGKVQQQKPQSLSRIWRAWSGIQIFGSQGGDALDHAELGFAGVQNSSRALSHSDRQDRPGWSLRTWKFAMAVCGAEPAKQARESVSSTNAQIQDGAPGNSICRQHIEAFLLGWHDNRANHRKVQPAIHETKREVWDILNAGPFNRFTCEGLLVHNCHSGNYLRFRNDWEQLFDEGVTELTTEGEKAKKEPSEKEKTEAKCPACSVLWTFKGSICGVCGYEKPIRGVSSVAGELQELEGKIKNNNVEQQGFYSELLFYAKSRGFKDGWAAHKYKEKYSVFPNGLSTTTKPTSSKTFNWIRSRNIAWAKSKEKQV